MFIGSPCKGGTGKSEENGLTDVYWIFCKRGTGKREGNGLTYVYWISL